MRFFRACRLNEADAEDLTQEVFVRLSSAQSPLSLRDPGTFVFTLARNLVRDRSRRLYTRALANSVAAEDAELTGDRPRPDERLEQQELLGQVQQILNKLKPKSRGSS
jgi:RNA polymerase sigma-70 factor (ECF subfamily)